MANTTQCNPLFFFRRKTLKSLDACFGKNGLLCNSNDSFYSFMFVKPITHCKIWTCLVLCWGKCAHQTNWNSKFKKLFIFRKCTHSVTVFPRIVVATTNLFLSLRCDNYSRETTIQERKLLFSRHSLGHLLWSTEASEIRYIYRFLP